MKVPITPIKHALGHEDSLYLPASRAQRAKNGNIFCLLHYHHDERNKNVERCNEDNQPNRDKSDDPFQPQCAEKRAVLLHPVGSHVALAGLLLESVADLIGLVDVIHLEFNHRGNVSNRNNILRRTQAGEGPCSVVIVEAGIEDSNHAEALIFGNDPKGSEVPLWTRHKDSGSDCGAEVVGHVLAEHDRRHRGDTSSHIGEVGGGSGR